MIYAKNRILRVLRRYNIYDKRLGVPVMNGKVANEILNILGDIRTISVCNNCSQQKNRKEKPQQFDVIILKERLKSAA